MRYIDCPCVDVEPSVTDALIKHCQTKGEALLPNLRALRWSESAGDTHKLQLLRALCSAPSLSLVSISAYDFVAQDIATITGTRPDLAHFSSTACISLLPPDSPIFAMCSLKSLRVAKMDESSFHQIGTLPYLTDLSTEVRDADSLHMNAARTPSQGDPAFPTLQRLRTLGTPATLIWVITQISSPILTSLSAGSPTEHLADILPMIETLFALPAVQSLQQLHLNVIVTGRSGEGAVEIAFADIAHSILPLRHLEDVRLSIRPRTRTLSISDADIALIKSAWSRLRKLSLCFNASDLFQDVREPILRPSLLALVDLALARPQLETLDVEVASVTEDDLVQLESISTRALGPFEHPTAFKLTWLTFARGEHRKRITFPADIPRLARALHRLFPLVGGSRATVNYYMWHKVDMEDDVRWLLYQLEELKSQESDVRASCFCFFGLMIYERRHDSMSSILQ